MQASHIPFGNYRARVTKRTTGRVKNGLASVELTFEVAAAPFAGRAVTGRFHSRVMLERARSLKKHQLVDIDVIVRRHRRGRNIPVVKDFRPAGQPTVVMYVNGVCGPKPANPRQPPCEFGPVSTLTELDSEALERDRREYLLDGMELPPMPLCDATTLNAIKSMIADEDGPSIQIPEQVQRPPYAAEYRLAMLRVGGKAGQRTLVDAETTFARYAGAEASVRLDIPTHISVYQYSDDLAMYQQAHAGSVAGYRGVVWGPWFVVELDDHTGPTLRLDACRNLVKALLRIGLTDKQIMVFYSGNSSTHVMFPTRICGASPQTNFEYACGHVCQTLVDEATRLLTPPPAPRPRSSFWLDMSEAREPGEPVACGSIKPQYDPRSDSTWHEPIDWNMYKPNAMLRAPNTLHEASGLYKIHLHIEELMTLDAEAIRHLATTPRPFKPANWSTYLDEDFVDFWQFAVAVADSRPFAMQQVIDKGSFVYADTFDFMHNGAPHGTRAARVFRAAVNLLQVGCSPEAVYQLVSPAALMSGMTPAEANHQLKGAVRYMQKARPVQRDAGFAPRADGAYEAGKP